MEPIAHIHTGFSEKFGIPRQSRLAETEGYIEFEPGYASPEAVRGLEEFSHIWLIWRFSETESKGWSPTVRPPKLGGNERKGVFATRSPFRPNPIGLSCVKLESVEIGRNGPILRVVGADMVDNTPIYDIKPYVPYADCAPEAKGSFAKEPPERMRVEFAANFTEGRNAAETAGAEAIRTDGTASKTAGAKGGKSGGTTNVKIDEKTKTVIEQLLSQDPRPAYQEDEDRIYGMVYDGLEIKFRAGRKQITVVDIRREYDKI